MADPITDTLPPPSSPTSSSLSSSDLDTESTGSFFHDRSTTLGTLMGVTSTAITFRTPSQPRDTISIAGAGAGAVATASSSTGINRNNKKKKNKRVPAELLRRRRWWRLCSDGEVKSASLGEFLEVERRFGDGAFYGDTTAELEGAMVAPPRDGVNGRVLFADGRVLPPAGEIDDGTSTAGILCRFPVSLTGICSGGVG